MRRIATALGLSAAFSSLAQNTWLPLSREVERPYSSIHALGSTMHTAIRPYRRSEVMALAPLDTSKQQDMRMRSSLMPAFDRWAGMRNGRSFRWGPLIDAQAMMSMDSSRSFAAHRAGAGFWLEKEFSAKWSVQFNGQVWNERYPIYMDSLVRNTQVSPGEGYAYGDTPNYTHYDWNGSVSWDPGKAFNLTLGRGRNFFGEGHRSLLLSDEAYSYPYLKVTTTIWKIKYVNLFSAMSDIRGADGDAADYHRKYSSMHYLSWNAHKRINVAVFEAIVWSSGDSAYPRGFDINYLNPIIFTRPVEFNLGSPDNALVGGGLNLKFGKRTLLYTQVMLDEFLLENVRSGLGWYANKQAVQAGLVSRNAFKVPGLVLRTEWNFVRPFMYTHSDTRQNYAHHGQPLAHPYGSNFQEVIAHVEWAPGRWRHVLRGSIAWLGQDSVFSNGNNIFRPESDRYVGPNGYSQNFGYHTAAPKSYSIMHIEARSGLLVDPSTGTRLEAGWLLRVHTPYSGSANVEQVFRLGVVCYFREQHPEQEPRYVLK